MLPYNNVQELENCKKTVIRQVIVYKTKDIFRADA